jgi:hypothetical protein
MPTAALLIPVYMLAKPVTFQGQALNHEREHCFDRKHANFVCVLPENDQNRRLAIETDLRRVCDPPV